MDYRDPRILKCHPVSLKLYGEINTDGLRENIEQHDIRVPLIIKGDDTIISGCRRCKAAVELGKKQVPVDVKSYSSDLEEKQAILYYNRYRDKTFSQKMNEAELIEEIVAEEAREKQLTELKQYQGETVRQKSDKREPLRTDETVATQVGLGSRDTYRKAEKVWNKAQGGDEKAKQTIKALDKDETTINKAYKDIIRGKERTDGFPKLWDIWKFKRDSSIQYPGNIPPDIIRNTLYYFTEPSNLIVDPFAGSGLTIDIAQEEGRQCLAYDIEPSRADILPHDIRDGFPEGAQGCDLIFMDPPYWSMRKKDYSLESVSSLSFDEWLEFLSQLAKDCYETVCQGGYIAFLIQNQTEKDIPEGMYYIDHAFIAYQKFTEANFTPVRRISCPLDSEVFKPQQVTTAKKERHLLGLVRDLLVMKK